MVVLSLRVDVWRMGVECGDWERREKECGREEERGVVEGEEEVKGKAG